MKECLPTCDFYRWIILQKTMCSKYGSTGPGKCLPSCIFHTVDRTSTSNNGIRSFGVINIYSSVWWSALSGIRFFQHTSLLMGGSCQQQALTLITTLMSSTYVPWTGASHLQRLLWWSSCNERALQVDHANNNEWATASLSLRYHGYLRQFFSPASIAKQPSTTFTSLSIPQQPWDTIIVTIIVVSSTNTRVITQQHTGTGDFVLRSTHLSRYKRECRVYLRNWWLTMIIN